VPALRIDGYVIVSADGMLANADRIMPDELKFEGDKRFFTAGLDSADLIVHGRRSYEDQPNSPLRKRTIVTRAIDGIAPDPSNPKATLWNPAGASFEAACDHAGVQTGTIAIIGGPDVFDMFMDRYDTFWLSQAPRVVLRGGVPVFSGVPRRSPQDILAAHGLRAGESKTLDVEESVTVTPWRRVAQTS
jgi:dihydrofolate reductase